MNIAEVTQSINYVVAGLKNSIQLNLIKTNTNSLSWSDYKKGIFKNTYYPLEYQWHLDNHQYSLILSDQSFFQFYYIFDGEGLKSAKLAYYPKPISTVDSLDDHLSAAESALYMEEEDLSNHLLNVVEEIENNSIYPSNTSHLRFDFDRRATSHEPAHMQFGGVNDIRLPANFFPLPYSFVHLVGSSLKQGNFIADAIAFSHSKGRQFLTKDINCLIALSHPT